MHSRSYKALFVLEVLAYVPLIACCGDNVYQKIFFPTANVMHVHLIVLYPASFSSGSWGGRVSLSPHTLSREQGCQLITGHLHKKIYNYFTVCTNSIFYWSPQENSLLAFTMNIAVKGQTSGSATERQYLAHEAFQQLLNLLEHRFYDSRDFL